MCATGQNMELFKRLRATAGQGPNYVGPSCDSFLTLADGWVNNAGDDGSYGTPSYSMAHGHCLLEGRIKGDMVSGGGTLTTLPVECWPMRKLIFSKALYNGPIHVDVNQYGEVSYHTDTSAEGSISLSGIIFSAPSDGKRFLPTVGVWYSDNTAFGDATFYMTSGFCLVEARLRGGSFAAGEQLATLPEGCRPTKRLSFSVNHQKLEWLGTAPAPAAPIPVPTLVEVTLSSIFLVPDESNAVRLDLQNGWSHYGGDYGKAKYVLMDNICVLQGMIKDGAQNVLIAQLPEACRPKANRLIFNMNLQDFSARVDVLSNGEMYFMNTESWTTTWLSQA